MTSLTKSLLFSAFLLGSIVNQANAETKFSHNLTFNKAIDKSLALMERSGYKDIEIITQSGSVSGEFVSMTKEVLILKRKTGSINMKAGKEKVLLSFIKLNSIEAISVYTLE